MCDDFGSDSSGFDDVGSSDFDSDIGSDVDSSDIDNDIDFDDVESFDISDDIDTIDFSDDIDIDDVESLDISDDIETIDFSDDIDIDDVESLDISDDIETIDFSDDIEDIDIDDVESLDISEDIETVDFSDDIEDIDIDDAESLDISEDIETVDFSDDIEDIDIDDAESLDISDDIETVDFSDDIEDIDIDDAESLDISDDIETIDFSDDVEDIDIDDVESLDISDDIETIDFSDDIDDIDLDDAESLDISEDVYTDEGINDNFNELDFEETDGDLEASLCEANDMPVSDNSYPINENIDWDSMLSDGDRDFINDIANNEDYTQEQKDFLINNLLGEVYERETTEPEYGARVRALTYDGRDAITRPPEESNDEVFIDEALVNEALNNENLLAEDLSDLRNYFESISNDESLTGDEKSFLINQALGMMSETGDLNYETYPTPSFEGFNAPDGYSEFTENIDEDVINELEEPFSGELSEQDYDAIYEGLSEYTFNGIDYLEQPERLDSSLQNFTSENWESLSIDEQKEQMLDLAQYIIDVTGLENPPEIEFYNNEKDGDYGGFNRATNTLSINEHMLYQNDEAADTVAHELWHAYQYERASNPRTKLDNMYLENFNDYITPSDDFEGYQSQILESEARAFAQQIKDRLKSY